MNYQITQKDRIVQEIVLYLKNSKSNEVVLTSGEIRKWPSVDAICANYNMKNICRAMRFVAGYTHEHIDGIDESTTYRVRYSHK